MTRSRWLALLCTLSLAGCFDAKPEPGDETAQVSEALTRNVDFEGGSVEDGELPGEDAPEVQLVPLEETVVMSPGETSLMALDVDNPDEDSDPVDSTLVQFEKGRSHIRVTKGAHGENVTGSDIENHFTVQSDICDSLCNKRFRIKVFETVRTRSGKIGRHNERFVELDCTLDGDASKCEGGNRGGTSVGPIGFDGNGAELLPDVINAVDALCACDGGESTSLFCSYPLADVDSSCAINALNLYATGLAGSDASGCAADNLSEAVACGRSCPADPSTCVQSLEKSCDPWRLYEAEAVIVGMCLSATDITGSGGSGGSGGSAGSFGGGGGSGGSDVTTKQCVTDVDCPSGQLCIASACVMSAAIAPDAGPGVDLTACVDSTQTNSSGRVNPECSSCLCSSAPNAAMACDAACWDMVLCLDANCPTGDITCIMANCSSFLAGLNQGSTIYTSFSSCPVCP